MPSTISISNAHNMADERLSPITEGYTGRTDIPFTLTRTGDLSGSSTVDWAVRGHGGTPADAADFVNGVFPTGTAYFWAGSSETTVNVPLRGDEAYEDFEFFAVDLRNPTGGATIGDGMGLALIRQDDFTMSISALDPVLSEGGDGVITTFRFLVDRQSDGATGFGSDWRVVGVGPNPATGGDFVGGVLPTGNIGFRSSQPAKWIEVQVRGDVSAEGDETFAVVLDGNYTGLTLLSASASAVIRDDDTPPPSPVVVAPAPVVVVAPVEPTPAPAPPPAAEAAVPVPAAPAPLPPITANLYGLTAQVVRIYGVMLDRAPEAAGVVYYSNLLSTGAETLGSLADNFSLSPEYIGRYGNTNDQQFVTQIYRNALSREPEAGAVDWYQARLNSGAMDRGDVMVGFSQSPENIGLTARDVQGVVDQYGIA